jgi:hypothetical protein
MGRELFDYAFKEYANRWMFKHPTPADFFRTMEDASAVDLDWFWRGWFFTNDHVDQDLAQVRWFQIESGDADVEEAFDRERAAEQPESISAIRNREDIPVTVVERDSATRDFYNEYDRLSADAIDRRDKSRYVEGLEEDELHILNSGDNFYELTIKSPGGLVMPIILEFEFTDGNKHVERLPAEIWRYNTESTSKVFRFSKEVQSISLDPFLEIADVDRGNNYWPPRPEPTRFELYKRNRRSSENPMQRAERARELEEEQQGTGGDQGGK